MQVEVAICTVFRHFSYHFTVFTALARAVASCVKSFMISLAMIKPATEGIKALLPGMSRRSVHLCWAPGGQMQ